MHQVDFMINMVYQQSLMQSCFTRFMIEEVESNFENCTKSLFEIFSMIMHPNERWIESSNMATGNDFSFLFSQSQRFFNYLKIFHIFSYRFFYQNVFARKYCFSQR